MQQLTAKKSPRFSVGNKSQASANPAQHPTATTKAPRALQISRNMSKAGNPRSRSQSGWNRLRAQVDVKSKHSQLGNLDVPVQVKGAFKRRNSMSALTVPTATASATKFSERSNKAVGSVTPTVAMPISVSSGRFGVSMSKEMNNLFNVSDYRM